MYHMHAIPKIVRLTIDGNKISKEKIEQLLKPGTVEMRDGKLSIYMEDIGKLKTPHFVKMMARNNSPLVRDFVNTVYDGIIDVPEGSLFRDYAEVKKVAVSWLANPSLVEWGKIYYFIDKDLQSFLGKLTPGNGTDNLIRKIAGEKNRPDDKRYEWKEILQVFKIEAIVSYHLYPAK